MVRAAGLESSRSRPDYTVSGTVRSAAGRRVAADDGAQAASVATAGSLTAGTGDADVPTPSAAGRFHYIPEAVAYAPTSDLAAGSTTTFSIPTAVGVPSSGVAAVVFHVVALDPTTTGYVNVFAAGASNPASRDLLYTTYVAATSVTAVPGTAGQFSLYTSAKVKPLVDVMGYYGTGDATGDSYEGLTPAPTMATVNIAAGATSTFTVTGGGGLPAVNVDAVSLGIISTGAEAYPDGPLHVYTPGSTPAAGTQDITVWGSYLPSYDHVIVAPSVSGQITISNPGSYQANISVLLYGEYLSASSTSDGAVFTPLPVATVYSSSSCSSDFNIQLSGVAGIPADPAGVVLSIAGAATDSTKPTETGELEDEVSVSDPDYESEYQQVLELGQSTSTMAISSTVTVVPSTAGALAFSCGPLSMAVNVSVLGYFTQLAPAAGPTGLGDESWFTKATWNLGGTQTAQANVANGNLTVQAVDSSPIQAHGHLAMLLRRAYNSDATGQGAGDIGLGWTLNIGDASDLLSDGVGTNLTVNAAVESLTNPTALTLTDRDGTAHVFTPNAVATDIKVATLSGSSLIPVPGLAQLAPTSLTLPAGLDTVCLDVTYTDPSGVHLGVWRFIGLKSASGGCSAASGTSPVVIGFAMERPDRLRTEYDAAGRLTDLIDGDGNDLRYTYADSSSGELATIREQTLTGAPRQFTFVYRALGADTTTCPAAATYAVDVTDPANRVTHYCLDGAPTSGTEHLLAVDEPDWTSGANGRYTYTYNGVGGASCSTTASGGTSATPVMCTASDTAGRTTSFGYSPAADEIPAAAANLTSVTDRLGRAWTLRYLYGQGVTDVDFAPPGTQAAGTARRSVYHYDLIGRVNLAVQGSIDVSFPAAVDALSETQYGWDLTFSGTSSSCRVGTATGPDNDLCYTDEFNQSLIGGLVLVSGLSVAEDSITEYSYDALGNTLLVRRHTAGGPVYAPTAANALDQTYGFHEQSFLADGTVSCVDYAPAGSGATTTTTGQCVGASSSTSGSPVLFTVSDNTSSLTPRGNAAGSGYAPYLTTYVHDDNSSSQPNVAPSGGGTCLAGAATGNTGELCQSTSPANVPVGSPSTPNIVTRYTYDQHGQRLTMTTPNEVAGTAGSCPAGSPNSTPQPYQYTYAADGSTDLSGTVNAGGWLIGVTDPCGQFVAYGYDAAGNRVRIWDRDATAASKLPLSSFPGTGALPPVGAAGPVPYSETRKASTATAIGNMPTPAAPANADYASPWLWTDMSRDATGDTATYSYDADGNATAVTAPRGQPGQSMAGLETTTFTYDADDEITATQLPTTADLTSSATQAPSTVHYDAFGDVSWTTDPDYTSSSNTHLTAYYYDALGRQTQVWNVRFATAPASGQATETGCSTVTGLPGTSGSVYACNTTNTVYDALGRAVETEGATGLTSDVQYDAAGRVTATATQRGDTKYTYLISRATYDADGDPLLTCPPREQTEGGDSTCVAPDYYGTTDTYTYAGRVASTTTYRSSTASAAQTSMVSYDADGNTTSVTSPVPGRPATRTSYDPLDRAVCMVAPQSHTSSAEVDYYTVTSYDPVGNVIAQTRPDTGASCTAPPSRETTYSYDPDERPTDSIDNPGTPDGNGGNDIHTGVGYDADGNTVVTYAPQAYANGSATPTPGTSYATRYVYDAQDRLQTAYTPRTDPGYAEDPGLVDTSGNPITDQTTECPTGAPGYASTAHVCVTNQVYDPAGNIVRSWLPTAAGVTTTASSGYGARHDDVVYSGDNLAISTTTPAPTGSGQTTVTTTTQYDGAGQPLVVTDPSGHQTITAYNPDHSIALRQLPTGTTLHRTFYAYNAAGQLTAEQDSDGVLTTRSYTDDGMPLATATDPGTVDSVDGYLYDQSGETTDVFSPAAMQALTTGAKDNNLQVPVPTVNTYDDDGQVATTETPLTANLSSPASVPVRITTYSYDSAGRRTLTTVCTGTGSFNRAAAPTTMAAAAAAFTPATGCNTGDVATSQGLKYYADDRVSDQTGRHGEDINTVYDLDGDQTQLTDSTNRFADITATYYPGGMPDTVSSDGRTTLYAYDGAGNTVGQGDTNTNPTTSTPVTATRYVYDDSEQLASMSAPQSAVPGATGTQLTGTYSFSYDAGGNALVATYPNGQKLTDVMNADDTLYSRTLTGTVGGTTTTLAKWGYTYDAGQRITSQTFQGLDANATSITGDTAVTGATDVYGYDTAGRVNKFTVGVAGSTGYSTSAITYNHDGDRLTDGSSSWTYRADDSIQTATSNGSTLTYAYDDAGNELTDGCNTNTYDGFDRLTSAVGSKTTGTCAATGDTTNTTYAYDALGRQTSRTVTNPTGSTTVTATRGTGLSGLGTTTLTYAGLSSSVEQEQFQVSATVTVPTTTSVKPPYGAATTVSAVLQFALDPSGDDWGLRQQVNGTTNSQQQLVDDGANNIGAVTNEGATNTAAAPLVACQVRYDPWGSELGATSGSPSTCSSVTTPNDVYYAANRMDGSTGDYQDGTRTYKPSDAGFTTADTYQSAPTSANVGLGADPLTRNSYSYVNGDPINYDDPTGHRLNCTTGAECSQSEYITSSVYQTKLEDAALQSSYADGYVAENNACWNGTPHGNLQSYGNFCANQANNAGLTAAGNTYEKDYAPQPPKPKKRSWLDRHLSAIVSGVVGAVVGFACDAATDGAAAQECGGLAGAISGALAGAIDCGLSCALKGAEIGGAIGFVTAGLGVVGGKIAGKVLDAAVARSATVAATVDTVSAAADAASSAVRSTFSRISNSAETADSTIAEQGATDSARTVEGVGNGDSGDAAEPEQSPTSCAATGGQSFSPSTKVVLADGTTRRLDQLHTGEAVKATDPKTGKTTARLIAAVWVHRDTDLLDVTVRAQGIDSVVDTTAHHPFWDQTRHAWTQAGQLPPGDGLLTDTGSTVTVISTKIVPGAAEMWDLTVTTDHDFYIAEGTNAVLVHNCGTEGAAEAGEEPAGSIIARTAQSQASRGSDYLKTFMSDAEQSAYEANPEGGSRFLGQAVHRATDAALQGDYPGRFIYSTIGPDFVDTTTGEMLELTTPGQVYAHTLRPGYGGVTYSTYGLGFG